MNGTGDRLRAVYKFLMSRTPAWDEQQAFLAVYEAGSLSAAARALNLSQPTVRARVEALERALGTVLFTRSVNGPVPTPGAYAVAAHTRARARARS